MLVEKSLIVYDNSSGRYRLLETVRQYAGDKLDLVRETERTQLRHLWHFLAIAEEAEPHCRGIEQSEWLDRLEAEHDNIRSALKYGFRSNTSDIGQSPASHLTQQSRAHSNSIAGLRIAGSLWRFWQVCCHLTEGARWLDLARLAGTGATPDSRAKVFSGAGTMAWMCGDHERHRLYHERALELFRESGDKWGIAFSLNCLGDNAKTRGETDLALSLLDESLQLFREVEDTWGIAFALNNLAEMKRVAGEYEQARSIYEESVLLFRQVGDRAATALGIHNMGLVALGSGQNDAANAYFRDALTISLEVGNKPTVALCLQGIAAVFARLGHPELSGRLFGAVESYLALIGFQVEPADEFQIVPIRATVDVPENAEHWAAGRAMTIEETLDQILEFHS